MTDNILQKRFNELYERARERKTREFTDFLNLNEISELKAALPVGCYTLYGGYKGAERCVAAFGEAEDFPIVCIKIEPTGLKFTEEPTHRDYLGSLLGLGISRETLGDILINEKTAYAFCLETIGGYICDNLTKVRKTPVKCEILQTVPEIVTKMPEPCGRIIPSLRADAVVASIYNLSRKNAADMFSQDKIFINACLCKKSSKILNEGDIVSVRGYGRFVFEGEGRRTRRDRIIIKVRIY